MLQHNFLYSLQGSIPDSDGSQNKDEDCAPLLGLQYEGVHVVIDPIHTSNVLVRGQSPYCLFHAKVFHMHFFAVTGIIGSYLYNYDFVYLAV